MTVDDFLTNIAVEFVYDLLKAGVSRLRDLARGSLEERALRRAFLSGQVGYVTGERAVAFGANANDVVVVTGDGNIVRIFKGSDADTIRQVFRQILDDIAADRYTAYLHAYLTALREYCRNLPYLTLYDIHPPKKLDEIYVPLRLRERKPEPGPEGDETHRFPGATPNILAIAEVLQQSLKPHLLILGEPGAGKSALLRRLAEHAWDKPQAIGLKKPHLPMLIPLRTLAFKGGALDRRLAAALGDELPLGEDLPEGFFHAWAQQMDAPWLLLLDGLDEVPEDRRTGLMQWLDGILPLIGDGRVIIATRPSVYDPEEWKNRSFSTYDILPFTLEQTQSLAEKWFRDEAPAFLRELKNVCVADLIGMPLLLTIAAKVYLCRKKETGVGSLPKRRSQLYEEFINIWMKEAELRGLRDELGDDVADVAKPTLARLALAMTEHPEWVDEDTLARVAAEYLCQELSLGKSRAATVGHRFVQVLGRRSGFFIPIELGRIVPKKKTYGWLHPTFREYLTAWWVVQTCKTDMECIWRQVISLRHKENWYPIALSALSILSDAGQDVTLLLTRIWQENDLRFCGDALREHPSIRAELGDAIIDELGAQARKEWWLGNWAIDLLGDLRGYPHAGEVLSAIGHDASVKPRTRIDAAEALEKLGQIDKAIHVWTGLANDARLDWDVHWSAGQALERLGRANEAAQVWSALANDMRAGEFVRVMAAEKWGKVGRTDEAGLVLQNLASGDDLFSSASAIRALKELKQRDALLKLARDTQVLGLVREAIPIAMEELGMIEELVELANDEQFLGFARVEAAEALGRLGRIDEAIFVLLAIARNEMTPR
ncbi:MAG: NACHT domain-containing protein, partial [Candidatus Methanomethylicaceae archaeon]